MAIILKTLFLSKLKIKFKIWSFLWLSPPYFLSLILEINIGKEEGGGSFGLENKQGSVWSGNPRHKTIWKPMWHYINHF